MRDRGSFLGLRDPLIHKTEERPDESNHYREPVFPFFPDVTVAEGYKKELDFKGQTG